MKNGQSVKNALFLPIYTSKFDPEKDKKVKEDNIVHEKNEKSEKRKK